MTTPNRKNITLVTKDGKATDAGKYWYENLHNVPAPTLYRYKQPLIRDTHVKRFDGKEIAVRKWSKTDGDWIITAAGRDYFKYNRSEFVVDVPYVRGELIQGIYDEDVYGIIKPTLQRDKDLWYKPLVDYNDAGYPISDSARAITTGSVRQRTRGLMRPRNMQASPAQQKQEVVESAINTLNKLPRVNGEDGVRYAVLMIESESLILWDESREIIVHEQRVDFYDDRPPTAETILGRPLRKFALPDGMYRSWDLHPDTFKSFDHGCVVQMFLSH